MVFGTGLFLVYILNLTLENTETSNFRGLMLFVVTIAYPTLNSVLTVLALMILLEIKNERHHFIPWVCESVGLLSVVVGDSWFAIIVLTAFVEQLWMSALLLSAHYLLIAGGYCVSAVPYQMAVKGPCFQGCIIRNANSKKVLFIPLHGILSDICWPVFTNAFSGNENKDFIINSNSLLSNNGNGTKEFVVGAILPFTGSLSSIGKSVKVALENAEHDVNKHFEETNSSFHFNLLWLIQRQVRRKV